MWLDYHVDASLCAFFLWFAHRPIPVIRSWARFGDFSYGIFIYAFPTQQLIALGHHTDHQPLLMALLRVPGHAVASVLSWHLVEGPCQAMKGRVANALQRPVDATHEWLAARCLRGLRGYRAGGRSIRRFRARARPGVHRPQQPAGSASARAAALADCRASRRGG